MFFLTSLTRLFEGWFAPVYIWLSKIYRSGGEKREWTSKAGGGGLATFNWVNSLFSGKTCRGGGWTRDGVKPPDTEINPGGLIPGFPMKWPWYTVRVHLSVSKRGVRDDVRVLLFSVFDNKRLCLSQTFDAPCSMAFFNNLSIFQKRFFSYLFVRLCQKAYNMRQYVVIICVDRRLL